LCALRKTLAAKNKIASSDLRAAEGLAEELGFQLAATRM
jgi:hypothetical protein